jgi:hypothetical protein
MKTKRRELMEELRQKTRAANRTLSRRFSAKRAEYGGLITPEQATALYAASQGIRIDRYYPPEFCLALQQLRPHRAPSAASEAVRTSATSSPVGRRPILVKLAGSLPQKIPHLSAAAHREAAEMSELYPLFYLFENSARSLVVERMSRKFTADWWNVAPIADPVKTRAADRMAKEGRHRWHGSRGGHPVYYIDLDDLHRIINRHWQDVFLDPLGDQARIQAMFTEMEELRNIVAHNNCLDHGDAARLKSNFDVWIRQLQSISPEPGPSGG